jgi:hypothetical protein
MKGAIEDAAHLVAVGHVMAIAAGAFEVDENERPDEAESQQCPDVLSTTWSNLLKSFGISDDNSQERILDEIKEKTDTLVEKLTELQVKIKKLEKLNKQSKPTDIESEDEQSGDETERSSPQKYEGKFNRTVLN